MGHSTKICIVFVLHSRSLINFTWQPVLVAKNKAEPNGQKLQSIQRVACIIFTPNAAIEILLGISPLHIFIQGEVKSSRAELFGIIPNKWFTKGH
jgi:hypothetical protein